MRTGPGTGHAVAYWLTAGDAVTVVGRNADGTWLQIEHRDRPGWISATLTDVAAEGVAELREPAPEPTPEAVEPTPEPVPAPQMVVRLTVRVTGSEANLHTGAGTDHPTVGQVREGDELSVTAFTSDGEWLEVAHPESGEAVWVYGPLTDMRDATITIGFAESGTTPEPGHIPVTVRPTVTVTGTVVNLRRGPGTDHATDGQVRAGMQLSVLGRNADGDWLQVMHPAATGELVWIYGPLTDIDAATVQALVEVSATATATVSVPREEPAATPVPTSAPQPTVAPQATTPTVPADCARRHTVNPNETGLQQITDWFGLDLAATAALNGIAPDTPLTAGIEICLPDAAGPQPQAQPLPAPQPQSQRIGRGSTLHFGVGQSDTPVPPFPTTRNGPSSPCRVCRSSTTRPAATIAASIPDSPTTGNSSSATTPPHGTGACANPRPAGMQSASTWVRYPNPSASSASKCGFRMPHGQTICD